MRRLLTSKLRRQQNNSCRLIQRTAVYETRTYGGVGGEESRGSPLSRFESTARENGSLVLTALNKHCSVGRHLSKRKQNAEADRRLRGSASAPDRAESDSKDSTEIRRVPRGALDGSAVRRGRPRKMGIE